MIENIRFIHFLTATALIELFMLILFRFTRYSSKVINNWYDNLGWTAILLDVLSILIGFYIAKFIYQYLVSPLLGNRCRFLPTCSEYFIEALKTQGLITGIKLGVKRILKCHPFKKLGGSHGLDFVPIPKDKKESNNG